MALLFPNSKKLHLRIMNTASPKTDTLFGGRLITVLHEAGTPEEIKVRQLRMADYERALPLLDDEIALTAFCCIPSTPDPRPFEKPWALTLQPESYEELQAAVQEVNAKGFFSYAARRSEKDRKAKEEIVRSMAAMPPETLKAVSEMANSASNTSSPRPRRILS